MKKLRIGIPDFSKDPRRRAKAKVALDLCYKLDLSPNGCRAMSASELRATLGNQSNRNSFAEYLHTLFQQVGAYSNINKTTYCYQTVPHRVQRLENALGMISGLREYAELQGKSFKHPIPRSEYKLTSDRHYAWWTTMRKEVRQKLFLDTHGVLYDYDIEAAKATLTLQTYKTYMEQHHPKLLEVSDTCKLPTWSELVYNRKAFRRSLAEEVLITEQQAKAVCQSVLNSAVASPHADNGICQIIGTAATKRLMENERYKGLRANFKTMWRFFKPSAAGLSAGQFMSAMYNKQEKQIMDAVDELIFADKWYIHDGFMTTEKIDIELLAEQIKIKTGLNIKFEENIFCGTNEIKEIEDEIDRVEEVSIDVSTAHVPSNVVHKFRGNITNVGVSTAHVPSNDVHKFRGNIAIAVTDVSAAHVPSNVVHKFSNSSKKFDIGAFLALDSPKVTSVVHKLNKRRWTKKT